MSGRKVKRGNIVHNPCRRFHDVPRSQVLATDGNPGIEYEYWLPSERYALYHGGRSPLRQAHRTASYLPWDHPAAAATTGSTAASGTTRPPPVTTRPPWCKTCAPLGLSESVNAESPGRKN